MRKLYMIALGPTINREAVVRRLEKKPGCGPWFYSIPNTVFIYSVGRATDLFNELHDPSDEKENLFVSEVPLSNAAGWLPKAHCALIAQNSIVHSYCLDFRGYWVDGRQSEMPESSGIYCVYACRVMANQKLSVSRLLYIGMAHNLRTRQMNHERHEEWQRCLRPGETLCFSCAELAVKSLSVCVAAMVFRHKPPCNDQLKDGFFRSTTQIRTTGANLYLLPEFVVYRTT